MDTIAYASAIDHLRPGFDFHHRLLLRKVRQFCPPPGHLLEIGCSSGEFLMAAKKEGYHVSGVEPASLDSHMKTKIGISILNERIERANLPQGAFDIAVAIQVIEHMHEPSILLEKMAQALKPGGYVYVETPNFGALARRCRSPRFMNLNVAPGHWHLFDPCSLERLFRQEGIDPVMSWTFFKALSAYGHGPIRPLIVGAMNSVLGPLGLANTLSLIGRKREGA